MLPDRLKRLSHLNWPHAHAAVSIGITPGGAGNFKTRSTESLGGQVWLEEAIFFSNGGLASSFVSLQASQDPKNEDVPTQPVGTESLLDTAFPTRARGELSDANFRDRRYTAEAHYPLLTRNPAIWYTEDDAINSRVKFHGVFRLGPRAPAEAVQIVDPAPSGFAISPPVRPRVTVAPRIAPATETLGLSHTERSVQSCFGLVLGAAAGGGGGGGGTAWGCHPRPGGGA